MPMGYVVNVVLAAACTALALYPPLRPRPLARAAFVLGVGFSELPHVAAVLLLGVTALTLSELGDPGRLGAGAVAVLALGAVTLAGLTVLARRAVRARAAVRDALAGAGTPVPGTDALPATSAWTRSDRRWALTSALTPLPWRPRTVERIADLRYGEHRRHRLDVYRRRGGPVGGPVLVYFHGGGYTSGGKHREARALLHRLAQRGWVCVSATYRLRPEAGFADHLGDAHRVLEWTQCHAAAYGGDPSTLVMAGSSAGAHLTALCALAPGRAADSASPGAPAVASPGAPTAPTAPTAPPRIAAAVCLYGYYGRYYGADRDGSPPSTPLALDAAGAPPFFLVHGDRDSYVPVDGARAFAAALRSRSAQPVVLAELPGGQHGFDVVSSWRMRAVLDALEVFLADPRVGVVRPAGVLDAGG
ncbi:alpha/beta hydrolase [Georgenia faecalis]|uniref:alpha/beta hydrolase n=1 Tax=Georgenia faecalis TaxID=2483799 RepID=UPI000FDCD2F2|nr:alpha/beta hydrolase [Georgenia faecalis]